MLSLKRTMICAVAWTFIGSMVATLAVAGEEGSSLADRAAKFLLQHPEADADGDGKLTPEEFRAYRQKKQPEKADTAVSEKPLREGDRSRHSEARGGGRGAARAESEPDGRIKKEESKAMKENNRGMGHWSGPDRSRKSFRPDGMRSRHGSGQSAERGWAGRGGPDMPGGRGWGGDDWKGMRGRRGWNEGPIDGFACQGCRKGLRGSCSMPGRGSVAGRARSEMRGPGDWGGGPMAGPGGFGPRPEGPAPWQGHFVDMLLHRFDDIDRDGNGQLGKDELLKLKHHLAVPGSVQGTGFRGAPFVPGRDRRGPGLGDGKGQGLWRKHAAHGNAGGKEWDGPKGPDRKDHKWGPQQRDDRRSGRKLNRGTPGSR